MHVYQYMSLVTLHFVVAQMGIRYTLNVEDKTITLLSNYLFNLTRLHVSEGDIIHIVLSQGKKNLDSNAVLSDDRNVLCRLHINWQIILSSENATNFNTDAVNIKPSGYILILNDYKNIESIVSKMQILRTSAHLWNPGAKFIIVLRAHRHFTQDIAISVINYMWSRNVFKVGLIFWSPKLTVITTMSARPFMSLFPNVLCRRVNHSDQLQSIVVHENTSLMPIEAFNFVPPLNFLGCPIVAETYPFPPYSIIEKMEYNNSSNFKYISGIEVLLIAISSQMYNFSVMYKTPDMTVNPWLTQFANGTDKGMMADVRDYECDISFAGVIPPALFYYLVDYSGAYQFSSVRWYVPALQGHIPHWVTLTRVLNTQTWLILGGVSVTVTAFYYFIQKLECSEIQECGLHKSWVSATMMLLGLALGMPTVRPPGQLHMRILFMSWVIFSMHILTAYNTSLFSLMTNPIKHNDINTLEDLKQSGLRTCISKLHYDYFYTLMEPKIRNAFNNVLICNDLENAVKRFIETHNFSMVAKEDRMDLLLKDLTSIHKLPEPFLVYPVVIVSSKGCILMARINRVIQAAVETGLVSKWKADVWLNYTTVTVKNDTHFKTFALDYEEIHWLFYILLYGLNIASAILLLEIGTYKLSTFLFSTQN